MFAVIVVDQLACGSVHGNAANTIRQNGSSAVLVLQFAFHHKQAALFDHVVVAFPNGGEHHHVDRAELVFDGDKPHVLVLFCEAWLNAFDQPPNGDFAVGFNFCKLV